MLMFAQYQKNPRFPGGGFSMPLYLTYPYLKTDH